MIGLPSWFVPVGLTVGVVGALAYTRDPLRSGDVVAVPRNVVLPFLAGGQFPPELAAITALTQAQRFAVRVSNPSVGTYAELWEPTMFDGRVVGWIDPTTNLPVESVAGVRVDVPVMAALPRASITDVYRNGKKIK